MPRWRRLPGPAPARACVAALAAKVGRKALRRNCDVVGLERTYDANAQLRRYRGRHSTLSRRVRDEQTEGGRRRESHWQMDSGAAPGADLCAAGMGKVR